MVKPQARSILILIWLSHWVSREGQGVTSTIHFFSTLSLVHCTKTCPLWVRAWTGLSCAHTTTRQSFSKAIRNIRLGVICTWRAAPSMPLMQQSKYVFPWLQACEYSPLHFPLKKKKKVRHSLYLFYSLTVNVFASGTNRSYWKQQYLLVHAPYLAKHLSNVLNWKLMTLAACLKSGSRLKALLDQRT